MIIRIKLICLVVFSVTIGLSQKDSLFALGTNASLHNTLENKSDLAAKISSTTNLLPPFFDDFSTGGIYPNPQKWIDSTTFRNETFPRAPFTLGVVTFDGLNKHGYPYNKFASITSSSPADTLTSKPIDMSFFSPGDSSIFVSFFYQSRGLGDAPETGDSLILEYYQPDSAKWYHAWGKAGYNLGVNDSSWKFVLLPIYNAAFFKSDFQFRFRNYATVSGAYDHWHLDYVYLNSGRTKADSLFKDMSFGYQASSLLKNYSAMPWWQFVNQNPNEWATNQPVFIRNNDTSTAATNLSVSDTIWNVTTNVAISAYNGFAYNVPNFSVGGWDNYPPHCNPPTNANINSTVFNSPTILAAQHYITYPANPNHENDTLMHYNHFLNYYAFDDGTAEAGYGFLNAFGAEMCVKITLTEADTLVGLDIYWNPIGNIQLISNSSYRTRIWADVGGMPQASGFLYQDSIKYPWYKINDSINAFTHDSLSSPFLMNAGTTYYVGITQTSNQSLNIGFDRNYNHKDRMFYNTNGTWTNSSFEGSYMMRPIMRKFNTYSSIKTESKEIKEVKIFPNPAQTHFTIFIERIKQGQFYKAELFDFYGRIVSTEMINSNNNQFNVSSIENGIYFLKITDSKNFSNSIKVQVLR